MFKFSVQCPFFLFVMALVLGLFCVSCEIQKKGKPKATDMDPLRTTDREWNSLGMWESQEGIKIRKKNHLLHHVGDSNFVFFIFLFCYSNENIHPFVMLERKTHKCYQMRSYHFICWWESKTVMLIMGFHIFHSFVPFFWRKTKRGTTTFWMFGNFKA